MSKGIMFNNAALMALNPEYAKAFARGENWALERSLLMDSLRRGEPERYRRKFDGKPHKWCGGACTSPEGCVTCTLPENEKMTQANRNYRRDHGD